MLKHKQNISYDVHKLFFSVAKNTILIYGFDSNEW